MRVFSKCYNERTRNCLEGSYVRLEAVLSADVSGGGKYSDMETKPRWIRDETRAGS